MPLPARHPAAASRRASSAAASASSAGSSTRSPSGEVTLTTLPGVPHETSDDGAGEPARDAELAWVAEPPSGSDLPGAARSDDAAPRPTALTVMAEHCVDDPVWDRPYGTGEPVDLPSLGVDDRLVGRLRAWNVQYERLALTDFTWESPQVEAAWELEGRHLAHALQDALPDVEVWLSSAATGTTRRVRRG